tara:strand:+ start:4824 stop:5600 length:777 start_codon:yes stop_codon:yes gene_type:complete
MAILKKDAKKKPAKAKQAKAQEKNIENENQEDNKIPNNSSAPDVAVAEIVTEAVTSGNKFTNRIMIGCVVFMILVISIYGLMAWQTSTRVSKLDENIQTTLKVVQELNEAVAKLASSQGELTTQQNLLGEAVAKAESSVTQMENTIPDAAAEKVSIETDKVIVQIKDLEKSLKSQGNSIVSVTSVVDKLGSQLRGFEDRLKNVQKLSADVEALVTLEKEKYLNVLTRQADLQEKQSGPDPIKVPRDPNMVFYSNESSD